MEVLKTEGEHSQGPEGSVENRGRSPREGGTLRMLMNDKNHV